MHAPRFLLRTELSHLRVFYEHPTSSQGVVVDGGAYFASTRSVNDSLTPFFPNHGRRLLISLHPHAVIAVFVF
jgi:hypothetical protein